VNFSDFFPYELFGFTTKKNTFIPFSQIHFCLDFFSLVLIHIHPMMLHVSPNPTQDLSDKKELKMGNSQIKFALQQEHFTKTVSITPEAQQSLMASVRSGKSLSSLFSRMGHSLSATSNSNTLKSGGGGVNREDSAGESHLISPLWYIPPTDPFYSPNESPFVMLQNHMSSSSSESGGSNNFNCSNPTTLTFNWSSLYSTEEIVALQPKKKFFVHLVLEWLRRFEQRTIVAEEESTSSSSSPLRKKNTQSPTHTQMEDDEDILMKVDFELEREALIGGGITMPTFNSSSSSSLSMEDGQNNENVLENQPRLIIDPLQNDIPTLRPASILDETIMEKKDREIMHALWTHKSAYPHFTIPSPFLLMTIGGNMPICTQSSLTSFLLLSVLKKAFNFTKVYSEVTSRKMKLQYNYTMKLILEWYQSGLLYLYNKYKFLVTVQTSSSSSSSPSSFFSWNVPTTNIGLISQDFNVWKNEFINEFMLLQNNYHTRVTNAMEIFCYQVFLGLTEEVEFDKEKFSMLKSNLTLKMMRSAFYENRFIKWIERPLKFPRFVTKEYSPDVDVPVGLINSGLSPGKSGGSNSSSSSGSGSLSGNGSGSNLITTISNKANWANCSRSEIDEQQIAYFGVNIIDSIAKCLLTPNTRYLTLPFQTALQQKESEKISDNHAISQRLFNITINVGSVLYELYMECERVIKKRHQHLSPERLQVLQEIMNTFFSKDTFHNDSRVSMIKEYVQTQIQYITKMMTTTLATSSDILNSRVMNKITNEFEKTSISSDSSSSSSSSTSTAIPAVENHQNKTQNWTSSKISSNQENMDDSRFTENEKIAMLESFIKTYDKKEFKEPVYQLSSLDLFEMKKAMTPPNSSLLAKLYPHFATNPNYVETDLTLRDILDIYQHMNFIYFYVIFGDKLFSSAQGRMITSSSILFPSYYNVLDEAWKWNLKEEIIENLGLLPIMQNDQSYITKLTPFYHAMLTFQCHMIIHCTGFQLAKSDTPVGTDD
jgi:hypothetical protein